MEKFKKVILDSSTLIALINKEKGFETVEEVIQHSVMSSVNVSEVAKYLIDQRQYEIDEVQNVIEHLVFNVMPFSSEQCYIAAKLYSITKTFGLSLGDRACIALGMYTGYPIYTADKIWKELNIKDVNIKLIR